jgi:hypothetical protein
MGKKLTNNIAVPVEIACSSCSASRKAAQIQCFDTLALEDSEVGMLL